MDYASSNKYHISFLLPNNTNSQPETLAAYLGRKGLSTNSFTADLLGMIIAVMVRMIQQ